MDQIIIGAGPAGIMAALQAAKSKHNVILLDGNDKIGRKLLTTGSGRCNITNQRIKSSDYECAASEFVRQVLDIYSPEKFCKDLESFGIPVYSTTDGWTYPLSNSASNVVDILESHLIISGVKLKTGSKVNKVFLKNGRFLVEFIDRKERLTADTLLFATGGKAYPVLGSDGELFSVIESLGHKINPVFPALAPLITEMKKTHRLQGVRQDVRLTLFKDGKKIKSNSGNIIFTNWGINGPGVMDISFIIGENEKSKFSLEINFIYPHEEILENVILKYRGSQIPFSLLLESLLSKKIIQTVFRIKNIPEHIKMADIDDDSLNLVLKVLKEFRVEVKGTRGFEFSQASSGGVKIDDINPGTMQSRINKNLFFAGEVMDVVGPCGGYNLHWAFATGFYCRAEYAKQ